MKTAEELYYSFIRQIDNNQKNVEGFFNEIMNLTWNEAIGAASNTIKPARKSYNSVLFANKQKQAILKLLK